MTFENVRVEWNDAVATVTIDRPKALNALNIPTLTELKSAFQTLQAEGRARAVILTGGGDKAFVAGADIRQMVEMSPREGRRFAELGLSVLDLIEALDAPVIAQVQGFALGGGTEIALACDLVYASTKARFGQPEILLGIIPGFGGTQRLARLVGRNRAKELVLLGEQFSAERALALGIVNEVVAPEALAGRVREVATRLAEFSPLAVAAGKHAINRGIDLPLATGLEIEKGAFGGLFGTYDQREGMGAFVAKRTPVFKGE